MRALRLIVGLMACLWLAGAVSVVQAQDAPAFSAYGCAFQTETNSLTIRASAVRGGEAVPETGIALTVSDASGTALPSSAVMVGRASPYQPVKVTLVLDITGSVPVRRVADAVQASFSTMPFDDEVAVIAFGRDVGTLSAFYKDKNALYNEQLQSLAPDPNSGNRLFETLFQAVDAVQPGTGTRQMVVVLTDSRRDPAITQPSADEIIRRANETGVTVYAATFRTRNGTPDNEELPRIAAATGGHVWDYSGDTTDEAVGAGVRANLDNFVAALNSELLVTVDASTLDASSGTVSLTLSANIGGTTVTDTVNCTVQQLNHAISFLNVVADEVITEPRVLEVAASSDLRMDDLTILFAINGVPEQNTPNNTFAFDPARVEPGATSLTAELRDPRGNTLASTQATVFVRYPLTLALVDAQGPLSGEVAFEATTADDPNLTTVFFAVRSASDPAAREFPLGAEQAAVSGGRARLPVDDIHDAVTIFFPTEPNDYEVVAYVPGGSPGEFFARSEPLALELGEPAAAITPTPEGTPQPEETSEAVTQAAEQTLIMGIPAVQFVGPLVVAAALFLLDLLLIRQINRGRVRRMIDSPDNIDLPDHPLKVSVVAGLNKSSYMLTKRTMTVGRGSANDINLGDDNNVSRQHGVIMWRRRKWYYTNRRRELKALIGKKRVVGYRLVELKDGSQIQIGSAVIVIHSEGFQSETQELIKTNLEGW
jgi:hypothetical protein